MIATINENTHILFKTTCSKLTRQSSVQLRGGDMQVTGVDTKLERTGLEGRIRADAIHFKIDLLSKIIRTGVLAWLAQH